MILPRDLLDNIGAAPNAPKMPRQMEIGRSALELIRVYEGFIPHTYDDKDPQAVRITQENKNTVKGVLTIGYGTTDPAYAFPGNIIGRDDADKLLLKHLNENVLPTIRRQVTVPLDQNQMDALASFIYNVGSGNFNTSTLLKRLNVGDYHGAATQFLRWVYDDGKKLRGLVRRRKAERDVFLSQPQEPV